MDSVFMFVRLFYDLEGNMRFTNRKIIAAVITALFLINSIPAFGENKNPVEDVSGEGIIVDFLVLRPLGIVATAGGCVFFVATLPFTVWSKKRIKQASHSLVKVPGKYTFVRPLGELSDHPEYY